MKIRMVRTPLELKEVTVWHPDFGMGRITGLSKDGHSAIQVCFEKSKAGKYSRIIRCDWLAAEDGFLVDPQNYKAKIPTFNPEAKAAARQRWLQYALEGYKGRQSQIRAIILTTSNGNRRNGVERTCSECGEKFRAKRADKDTCSAACRKRRSRAGKGKVMQPAVKLVPFQEWLAEHNL